MMELASVCALLPVSSRRAIRIREVGVHLRLPLYLLGVSVGFGVLFAAHTRAAYADLYAMMLSAVPRSFALLIVEQTPAFVRVSAILIAGWVLVVLCVCVAYTQALIGPTVALRRQIQALKRGDTTGRLQIRRRDRIFRGLAEELNELTFVLSARGRAEGEAGPDAPLTTAP
jgi:hypothetical protein